MVSRSTWAPPHMAVGYHPACSSQPGAYPCFPIMPRFGLTGLGRGGGGGGGAAGGGGGGRGGAGGARMGRGGGPMVDGGGPVFTGGGRMPPQFGSRRFGRGFRFPSRFGPFFADGSWGGGWWPWECPGWMWPWCPPSSYPFYSLPALRPGLMGLGRAIPLNSQVPRYGMSGLGLFNVTTDPTTGLADYSSWSLPEFAILGFAGLVLTYLFYAGFMQAGQTVYRGQAAGRRRRVAKAKKLREKAKRLEEGEGRFFGLI